MADIKICGLKDPDMVRRAAESGAKWIGFVFAEASPRAVTMDAAASLLLQVRGAIPVALLVDPTDADLSAVMALDFPVLQLHGSESPERVEAIKNATGREIWKAIGVSDAPDLAAAGQYSAADRLLIDAKPPRGSAQTGGHGQPFDWSILSGWQASKPWILAGGLTPENVADAICVTGADAVDVSSGVEVSKGVKSYDLIRSFIAAAA